MSKRREKNFQIVSYNFAWKAKKSASNSRNVMFCVMFRVMFWSEKAVYYQNCFGIVSHSIRFKNYADFYKKTRKPA